MNNVIECETSKKNMLSFHATEQKQKFQLCGGKGQKYKNEKKYMWNTITNTNSPSGHVFILVGSHGRIMRWGNIMRCFDLSFVRPVHFIRKSTEFHDM